MYTRTRSILMYRNGNPVRPDVVVLEKSVTLPRTSNERFNRLEISTTVARTRTHSPELTKVRSSSILGNSSRCQ